MLKFHWSQYADVYFDFSRGFATIVRMIWAVHLPGSDRYQQSHFKIGPASHYFSNLNISEWFFLVFDSTSRIQLHVAKELMSQDDCS